MKRRLRRQGAALAVALCTMLIVMLIAGVVVRSLVVANRQSRRQQQDLQAQWLAEAALMRAKAQLLRQPNYTGEQWTPAVGAANEGGVAEIQVKPDDAGADRLQINVLASYPNHEWRRATIQRQQVIPAGLTRSSSAKTNTAKINTAEKTP